MAYKIKQEKIECEDLEIELTDGTVKTYHPVLSSDTAVKEYRELINNLNKIDFNNIQEDMYEAVGAVIIQFLNMLFDEEQTIDMLTIFKNRYVELFSAIFPYLEDVIFPYIEKLNEDRKNYYQNALNETV